MRAGIWNWEFALKKLSGPHHGHSIMHGDTMSKLEPCFAGITSLLWKHSTSFVVGVKYKANYLEDKSYIMFFVALFIFLIL
jgi:hypothetical protein